MKPTMTHSGFSIFRTGAALLLAFSLGGSLVARAQVLEYEGFDYSGTALDGQNGGDGWDANAWTNPDGSAVLSNDGVSLSYPDNVTYAPRGSRLTFAIAGQAERRLGAPISMKAEGDTYYCTALVKRQGDVWFEFIDDGTNVRWRFGGTGDANANTGFVGVSANVSANDIFPVGETVYLVAKLITHTATSPGDEFFLNVYRAGESVPLDEPTTWQISGAQNSGVTLTRFRIRNASYLPLEVDEIRVGTRYADVVTGAVGDVPVILQDPSPTAEYVGGRAQFTVEATGAPPLYYQWNYEGTPLPGQTTPTLSLINLQLAQAGNYSCTVSNAIGVTHSQPARLDVTAITDITTGLQALWHFDEKTGLIAHDATPNHNDGALINFTGDDSQWIPSDYNGAINFNRSLQQYVEVPHAPSLGVNLANHFSVTAWFRSRAPLPLEEKTYRLLEKENTFFFLQGTPNNTPFGTGGMNLLVKKNGGNVMAGIGESLLANRWYHLAGTFDGATLRVYLDGVLKDSVPLDGPIDTTTAPLRIGSDYVVNGPGSLFDGAVDEVGIWERPLSAAEILELAGKAGPPEVLEHPQSVTRYAGGSAVLRVRVRGQEPMRYLWYHGTSEIRAATTATLSLVNLQLEDAGEYHCLVSNDLGEAASESAQVTVTAVTDLADGLELQFKFDDTTGLIATDSSGQGRPGQLENYPDATSHWVSGQVGNALSFDGLANRVLVSNSADLALGTDATFAFWIKPTSYGSAYDTGSYVRHVGRVLRKGSYLDLETVDDPASVRATLRANGVSAPQYALALNEWQHFVVVYQAGTVSFYKNGFRLGDPIPGSLGASNANALVLGNYDDSPAGANYFAGSMDEVGIWARPLSEVEILSLAGRDASGVPVIVTTPQSATRYVGGTVSFLVEATGKRPVVYTWRHNGQPLPDTNTNRLVLKNLTLAEAGNYTVAVQNDLGTADSTPPAVLTVLQVTNVATGLIGYWTFDETEGTVFADSSGRGHHATLQNATIIPGTAGVVGGAFDFDGMDDFAVVPHAAELNLTDQATVSIWINPRSLGDVGGHDRMVRKDINLDFSLVKAGSTFRISGGANKVPYEAPANSVELNRWQHLAVVAKNDTLQFFKNGRSLGPPFPGAFGPANLSDLVIGNFGPDLSIVRLFNGYMDELGLWNRALSASEIDGIYQNGLVGQGLNAPYIPFAIEAIDFPSAQQVRLVYFSPYTDRQHVVQIKSDLNPAGWADVAATTFTPLGNGRVQAVFNKPAGDAFFRIAALPKPLLFADDFETGGPGWTHGGAGDNWELGTPVNGPGAAFSGVNVYATSLTGNLLPFSDNYLRSPAINLAGVSRATLTFREWRNMDPDPIFHGTIVNVLEAATGSLIVQLDTQSGATSGWQLRTLPLPMPALGQSVILEFKVYCDNFNLREGWYLDDVQVIPE